MLSPAYNLSIPLPLPFSRAAQPDRGVTLFQFWSHVSLVVIGLALVLPLAFDGVGGRIRAPPLPAPGHSSDTQVCVCVCVFSWWACVAPCRGSPPVTPRPTPATHACTSMRQTTTTSGARLARSRRPGPWAVGRFVEDFSFACVALVGVVGLLILIVFLVLASDLDRHEMAYVAMTADPFAASTLCLFISGTMAGCMLLAPALRANGWIDTDFMG